MDGCTAPRLAIIIPAYNAEKYIEASIRSVLGQSCGDFKLIIVNDGSTDETPAILSALSREDSRVCPVSSENRGPAMARNLALTLVDHATEYVMFMDADDELLPGALDYALEGAHGEDMVVFGFSIRREDGSERQYSEPQQRLCGADIGGALAPLYKANLLNQVWGKLFRRELIVGNAIAFPDYRWGEDRLFIFACLEKAKSLAVLPECMYRYVMHPGESLITKYCDSKFQVCLESDDKVQELCRRFNIEDEADFRYMFAKSVFSCITTLFTPSCPLSEQEKRDYVRAIAENEHVRRRCWDVFGGLSPNLLCGILRTGNAALILAVFRLVAFAGKAAPGLFMIIKHRK